MTTKIATAYGLDVPAMYLSRESGPNALVTLRQGAPVMVINTAMLKMVRDDHDLMATVIGHE